ncbi:hypothetical protein J8L98_24555 [Pseudoalteromonas sp. MMG013]|uniref:hypothetical protein n=1 Tax=Pseudoalteromonas sp. MMG013 TaxID=2822687 RepID=UPI001B396287|nr:hypothetical protein [Pseudoalteromonas sp. MMG013]MBQ4864855.1 hypothetical protein [Pseudoalteromonas sp. MMG013]
MKKYVKYIWVAFLVLSLGKMLYAKYENDSQYKQLKNSVEEYFLEGDPNLKLSWFKIQDQTMALTIDILALSPLIKKTELDKVRKKSRDYIYQKVCHHPTLRSYLDDGNFISVDFRNGKKPPFMNLQINKSTCV